MKTPRELLLGRHTNEGPALDRIRGEIVDQIANRPPSLASKLWQELIIPARHAWMCLGAAWVVIIGLNLSSGRDAAVHANETGPMNPNSVIALQRQEQLMAQLAEKDTEPSSPAKAPERRPRSEAPVEYKVV
jgi:hypothetical protein